MESNKREELLKNRGLGATLKAAYGVFLSRFQFVVKHLWPAALLFAVLGPLALMAGMFSAQSGPASLWLMVPVILLVFVAEVVLYSRIAQLLNDKPWKWNLWRMLKLALAAIGVNVVVSVIVSIVWVLAWVLFTPESSATPVEAQLSMEQIAAASLKIVAVVGVVSLLCAVLMVPFAFSFTKYVVDTESGMRQVFGSSYKQGLRHWGYIFATMMLSGLLVMLAGFLFCLPLVIVYVALMLDMQGLARGDASGLPGGFPWLVYFVSVITYFVLSFVMVFLAYVCYYMYGTVETRQKEREAGDKMSAIKLAEEGI